MTTDTTREPQAADVPDPEAAAIWRDLDARDAAASPPDPVGADAPEPGASPGAGSTPPDGGGQPATDDIWSSASEPHRAAFSAAQQRLKALEHATRSDRGRLTALQRERDALLQELAAHRAAKTTGQDKPGIRDALKALQDEYPEVARPLEQILTQVQDSVGEVARKANRIDQWEQQAAKAAEDEALAREEQALSRMHPNWQDVVARPEFTTWLKSQPRYVTEGINRNAEAIVDAVEAADIIGRFLATLPPAPADAAAARAAPQTSAVSAERRRQQLQTAAALQSRGAPRTGGAPPDDPEAAWSYFERLDQEKARIR